MYFCLFFESLDTSLESFFIRVTIQAIFLCCLNIQVLTFWTVQINHCMTCTRAIEKSRWLLMLSKRSWGTLVLLNDQYIDFIQYLHFIGRNYFGYLGSIKILATTCPVWTAHMSTLFFIHLCFLLIHFLLTFIYEWFCLLFLSISLCSPVRQPAEFLNNSLFVTLA